METESEMERRTPHPPPMMTSFGLSSRLRATYASVSSTRALIEDESTSDSSSSMRTLAICRFFFPPRSSWSASGLTGTLCAHHPCRLKPGHTRKRTLRPSLFYRLSHPKLRKRELPSCLLR